MLARRVLLVAMTSMIAAPALAQTGRGDAAKDATKDMPAGTAAAAGKMGAPEQKHAMDTLAVGSMSLLASRVALNKARDEDVKEFAEFEVAEQETIADVLKSMKDGTVSGKVTAPSDTDVRQQLSEEDNATLQKMEKMEGKEFDRAYIRAQIEGHQKLLRIQDEYLAIGNEPGHINVAKLARGQIKEHLQLLADAQDDDDKSTTGRSGGRKN